MQIEETERVSSWLVDQDAEQKMEENTVLSTTDTLILAFMPST